MTAPIPAFEDARLATLQSLRLLDTLPEPDFDDLVEAACAIMDVPISLVPLIDRDRQWFKAKRGVDVCETSRDLAFCAHAILQTEPLVVPDATQDPRFADNPLVTGEFNIRFYAGFPIQIEGQPIGTLCCADLQPRTPTPRQISAVTALSRQAASLMRARLRAEVYAESERRFVSFLDHSPAIAFLKDDERRMRFANRRHATVFGYEPGTIIGLRDEDRMPEEFAEHLRQHDEEVLRTGATLERDEIVPLPDGTPLVWNIHKFPLEIGGRTWVGGVAIDVTVQRRAEATIQAQALDLEAALESSRLAAVRFEQLFDGMPVACYSHDAEGILFEWNIAAEALWNVPSEEALMGSIYEVVVSPDNRETKRETVARVFAGESVLGEERRETMRDGSKKWLLTNTFPLRSPSGAIVGAVSANVDVTDRKRMEEALRESEGRFRAMIESLHEGLVKQDAEGRIVLWNRSAERVLGLTGDQLQGRSSMDPRWRTVHEDGSQFPGSEHPSALALRDGVSHHGIMGVHRPNGELRWLSVNASPIFGDDQRPRATVSSFLDVTERVEQERRIQEHSEELVTANARLEALATTDGLTGLRNHRYFQDFLRRKIDQCRDTGLPLSIALLDVDRFKTYNDDFGHQAGDAVLRAVGQTLEEGVRPGDLVARYGGEEFVIVMPGTDEASACAIAERVRGMLAATPFELRAVTASFGVASFGSGLSDAPSLIHAADEALYQSKADGRNRVTLWREMALSAPGLSR